MTTLDEYLQVHERTLLILPSSLQLVQEGIAATGCEARLAEIHQNWSVLPYSEAPSSGFCAHKSTRYLVEFNEPGDGAAFQAWFDAKQAQHV